MDVGDKIKDLRLKLGISQQQLANESGVSLATISNIELKKIEKPSDLALAKIAKALGVDYKELGVK